MDPIKSYMDRHYSKNPSTLASSLFYHIDRHHDHLRSGGVFTYPCEVQGCDNKSYPNTACAECLGKVVERFLPGYGEKFIEVSDYYWSMRETLHARIMSSVGRSPSSLPPRHFLVTAHLTDCEDETFYVRAGSADEAERITRDHLLKWVEDQGDDPPPSLDVYATMIAEISGPPAQLHTPMGVVQFPHPINPL